MEDQRWWWQAQEEEEGLLTPEEVAHYHEHGYVIPSRFRFDDSTLARIAADHAALLARHAAEHPDWVDYCPALLPHDLSFVNYARDPRVLAMLRQLLGADLALWTMSFFAKPARTGREVPMHQDGEYWPIRPLATCTAWVAVDASTIHNGCLRVVPGSHRRRSLLRHVERHDPANRLALRREALPSEYDTSAAVDVLLEPGQISLHDVFLVHGSRANTSGGPRRGMTMRFMPTTSTFERHKPHDNEAEGAADSIAATGSHLRFNPLFLMCGIDRSEANGASRQANEYALAAAAAGEGRFRAALSKM